MTHEPCKPPMPFRILRNVESSPCALYYRTKAARDKAAQRWADTTGKTVVTELWDGGDSPSWWSDGITKPANATVTMHIENYYEGGSTCPVVTVVTATIPLPPPKTDMHAYEDWSNTHINSYTGTDREDDGACYFVEITASTVPALIGQEFEFEV